MAMLRSSTSRCTLAASLFLVAFGLQANVDSAPAAATRDHSDLAPALSTRESSDLGIELAGSADKPKKKHHSTEEIEETLPASPCLNVTIDALTGAMPPCGTILSYKGVNASGYAAVAAEAAGMIFADDAYGETVLDAVTQASAAKAAQMTADTLSAYKIPSILDDDIPDANVGLIYPGDFTPAEYTVPDGPCPGDSAPCSPAVVPSMVSPPVAPAPPAYACPCDCSLMVPAQPGSTVPARAAVNMEMCGCCSQKLGLAQTAKHSEIETRKGIALRGRQGA